MSDLHSIVKMGDPTSSNVVLLHGFAGYAEVWQPVIDDLGREHTCRAYDLPGHGRSLHHSAIGGAGRMAKAVAEDLQAKGSDIVHLVGHSMGGAVATLVALRIPELVASVTLLAPGGFGPEINHRLLARFAQAQGEEELRAILENMFGWNKNVPADMLNAMIARGLRLSVRRSVRSMTPPRGRSLVLSASSRSQRRALRARFAPLFGVAVLVTNTWAAALGANPSTTLPSKRQSSSSRV